MRLFKSILAVCFQLPGDVGVLVDRLRTLSVTEGTEIDDEAVLLRDAPPATFENVVSFGRYAPPAEVAPAGNGAQDRLHGAFLHRLIMLAISFGVMVSMPCSSQWLTIRSIRRVICAVS